MVKGSDGEIDEQGSNWSRFLHSFAHEYLCESMNVSLHVTFDLNSREDRATIL